MYKLNRFDTCAMRCKTEVLTHDVSHSYVLLMLSMLLLHGLYRPKYTVKELPSYLVKERHSLTLVQTAQDDKRSHGDTHASFTVFQVCSNNSTSMITLIVHHVHLMCVCQQCCLVLASVQLYVQHCCNVVCLNALFNTVKLLELVHTHSTRVARCV
jgi:hypothetical protein